MITAKTKRKNGKGSGRKLLLSLFLLFLIAGVATFFLLRFSADKTEESTTEATYYFYPTYEGDIMENQDYLDLDRMISFCDDAGGYGVTQSITDENLTEFTPQVRFLKEWIECMIDGDCDEYNAITGTKSEFSPQMLYNITVYYIDEMNYRVDFMIYQNDGTLWKDVGSDAIRHRYVTLSENGESYVISTIKTK